jgi:hypothetical protein
VAWVATGEREWQGPELRFGPEGTAMRFTNAAELVSIMVMTVLIRVKRCQNFERANGLLYMSVA